MPVVPVLGELSRYMTPLALGLWARLIVSVVPERIMLPLAVPGLAVGGFVYDLQSGVLRRVC